MKEKNKIKKVLNPEENSRWKVPNQRRLTSLKV